MRTYRALALPWVFGFFFRWVSAHKNLFQIQYCVSIRPCTPPSCALCHGRKLRHPCLGIRRQNYKGLVDPIRPPASNSAPPIGPDNDGKLYAVAVTSMAKRSLRAGGHALAASTTSTCTTFPRVK